MQSHRRYSFLAQRSLCSNDILKGMELKKKTTTCVYFTTEDGVDVFFRKKKKKSIRVDGTGKTRLTERNGFYSASFSPSGEFYIENFQGYALDLTQVCVLYASPCFFFFNAISKHTQPLKKKKYMFVVIECFGEKKKGSHVDVTIFSRSKLLDGHGIEC